MINEPDAQGCTPLHYASRHGHIRCLQRLMDLGACPNVKDANNESPLHFAARSVAMRSSLDMMQERNDLTRPDLTGGISSSLAGRLDGTWLD